MPSKRGGFLRLVFWLALLVFGSALALLPAAHSQAKAFTVDTTADAPDQSPGDGVCSIAGSGCSLRAAIQETNALPGLDSVVLPPGTYTLTVSGFGEEAAVTGDLDITDSVLLQGVHPSRPVIDANHLDRGLDVKPGASVEIEFVTIENGGRPLTADASGIRNQGSLTLRNSIVRSSVAPANPGGRGGGISNSGTASIEYSEISGNQAVEGGGISNSGALTLASSTVDGNTSTGFFGGGGVFNTGNMEIRESTVSGNSATRPLGGSAFGGGIMNLPESSTPATLSISNSTISGNSAISLGGGIGNFGNSIIGGGQIPAYLTITGSTIASNAGGEGGGIYGESGEIVQMSVLAGNTPTNCSGTFSSSGNVVSDSTCGSAIVSDPLLGPLASNGGPTLTHALGSGSPAIDAFDSAACPATDQRGVARPKDGDGDSQARCDIGALEVDPLLSPTDFDGDRVLDEVEPPCGSIPWDPGSIPERTDGAFFGVDDDGDLAIDEVLPAGADAFDCDGDGWRGSPESGRPLCGNGSNDDGVIFGGADDGVVDDGCPGGPAQEGAFSEAQFNIGSGDQDPCGGDGWPADVVSGGASTNTVNLQDLGSFVAPIRRLNTSPGQAGFSSRWDLVPGRGGSLQWITLQDLASLVAGPTATPPMLGGAKAFNGPPCPWAP